MVVWGSLVAAKAAVEMAGMEAAKGGGEEEVRGRKRTHTQERRRKKAGVVSEAWW